MRRAGEIAVAFQDASLLPWRTVTANVALARSSPRAPAGRGEGRSELIDLVGLHGFETDRAGRAVGRDAPARGHRPRASSPNPRLLLLDEPFGAVDELTRRRLNLELPPIWERRASTTLLVTHSIPEAVLLADEVVVMTPRPGRHRRRRCPSRSSGRARPAALPVFHELVDAVAGCSRRRRGGGRRDVTAAPTQLLAGSPGPARPVALRAGRRRPRLCRCRRPGRLGAPRLDGVRRYVHFVGPIAIVRSCVADRPVPAQPPPTGSPHCGRSCWATWPPSPSPPSSAPCRSYGVPCRTSRSSSAASRSSRSPRSCASAGPGDTPQVAVGALAVFYTTLTRPGGAALGRARALDVVAAYGRAGCSRWSTSGPAAAVPALFAGVQVAAPAAFLGALVGEFTGA